MSITQTEKIEKPALFSDFIDEDYVQVEGLTHKDFAFRDYIYFEAQRHPNIYFIVSGFVRLGCLDDQGNKIVKDILCPGGLFRANQPAKGKSKS